LYIGAAALHLFVAAAFCSEMTEFASFRTKLSESRFFRTEINQQWEAVMGQDLSENRTEFSQTNAIRFWNSLLLPTGSGI
jgi:hypothetical protein